MRIVALVRWLQGKKTYIIVALLVMYQVSGHFLNGTAIDWTAILEGLGLGALRAGVAKGATR